jgi:hypothetical protein
MQCFGRLSTSKQPFPAKRSRLHSVAEVADFRELSSSLEIQNRLAVSTGAVSLSHQVQRQSICLDVLTRTRNKKRRALPGLPDSDSAL